MKTKGSINNNTWKQNALFLAPNITCISLFLCSWTLQSYQINWSLYQLYSSFLSKEKCNCLSHVVMVTLDVRDRDVCDCILPVFFRRWGRLSTRHPYAVVLSCDRMGFHGCDWCDRRDPHPKWHHTVRQTITFLFWKCYLLRCLFLKCFLSLFTIVHFYWP